MVLRLVFIDVYFYFNSRDNSFENSVFQISIGLLAGALTIGIIRLRKWPKARHMNERNA